jgi:signal peptidase
MIVIVELLAIVIFMLSILIYFIIRGFKLAPLEKLRLHLERAQRGGQVKEWIDRAWRREVPVVRIAVVLGIFGCLLVMALTYKLFWTVVTSDSMVPTFERGDMFLAQAIYIEPEVGDIIVFKRKDVNLPVSHRILRISDDKIYTGGDASGADRWYITREDIIAEAVMIRGEPIVIKGFGKYFILDVKELRSIGPYGQEYLFYKNLVQLFKSYALAIMIISVTLYVYLEVRGKKLRV